MSAADEAYARLLAARRTVSEHERIEAEKERKREALQARIQRKLLPVY